MSEFPYMSWWIADYFADTSHLTCEQHGVYLILMAIAWQQPNGPAIPNDMPWLKRAFQAKCSDMHGNKFNRLVPPILKAFFHQLPDAKWQQFRQFSEWEKCRKRQTNARENAAKRWLQTRNVNDLERAVAMRRQSHGNANHKEDNSTSSFVTPETNGAEHPAVGRATAPPAGAPALPPHAEPRQNGVASANLTAIIKQKGWVP